MIGNRLTAFVTAVALLSINCTYAETPAIKDCVANETCSVQPTVVAAAPMTTITTPKNVLKTTAVGGGSSQSVRYDVSGNDSKGSTIKDVIVRVDDKIVTPLVGDKTNDFGNATSGSSNVTPVVKAPVGKTNSKIIETNLPMINITNTTSITTTTTTTTTEFTSVSSPKYLPENDPEVVRFVPFKYCLCDLIVSILNRFLYIYILLNTVKN